VRWCNPGVTRWGFHGGIDGISVAPSSNAGLKTDEPCFMIADQLDVLIRHVLAFIVRKFALRAQSDWAEELVDVGAPRNAKR